MSPGFKLSGESVRIFYVAPGHRGDAVFEKWIGTVRNSCHPLELEPAFPKGHGGTSVPRVEGTGLVELSQMFGAAPDVSQGGGQNSPPQPQPPAWS